MDYSNPDQMYQNVNSVPNNPFWSGYQGGQFQQQAKPFMDMMRQSQTMDLQKKAMETGEFTGPEAQAQRSAGRRESTATSELGIDTARQKQRALPDLTDAEIAKARQTVMNAKSAPAREFIAEAGALADHFDNVPEEQRQSAYDQFINRWHMTHPDAILPEHLRKYSPELHREMKAMHYASVNSVEQVQRERLEGMKIEGNLQNTVLHNAGAANTATIQGGYHVAGAQVHANAAETPQKAVARTRRELRADPNNEDAQRELKGYLEQDFNDKFQKDGLANMLQLQAVQDPKQLSRYLTYKEQQKFRHFANEGLYGDIDGAGRSWVLRAIEANPDAGLENVIAEGRSRGKLKQQKKK